MLTSAWGRAANSANYLFFVCVKICLSIFPNDVWDKLWVLIRPVPEVSLLM